MPTYCYSNDNLTVEDVFPMGEAPKSVTRGGKLFFRDINAEHQGMRGGNAWPMYSRSLGVTPKHIPEAAADLAKAGIAADFNKQGRLKINDNGHRNQVMAHYDAGDLDAGYSQRTTD